MDRSLGVRLRLVTDFAMAARNAVVSMQSISAGLAEVKKQGATSNVTALTELRASLDSLGDRIGLATAKMDAFGNTVGAMGSRSRAAVGDVDAMISATMRMADSADVAKTALGRLGTSMTSLGSTVAIDRAGTALHGTALEAITAKRTVDELEASLVRLPTTKVVQIAIGGGITGSALAALQASGSSLASRYVPLPQGALGDERSGQRALPSGARETPLGNGQFYMPGGGGIGNIPPSGGGGAGGGANWGERFGNAGKSLGRAGSAMSGQGMGMMFGGAMVLVPIVEMGKALTDIQDLQSRNYEAMRASGMSQGTAVKLEAAMEKLTGQIGGNFRENLAAHYVLVSALPPSATTNPNSKATQEAIVGMQRRLLMTGVAGRSSTHPINQEAMTLDTVATAHNLGLDMSTPQKALKAVTDTTNLLINLKNRTATEIDLAAQTFKQIGPLAASLGIKPEDESAIVGLLAEAKIRGSQAGNQVKRLILRQALPPAKLQAMNEFTQSPEGGGSNISLFNKDGSARSLVEVAGTVADYQRMHQLTAQQRAKMDAMMSGLYAIPALSTLINASYTHGGTSGMQAYGRSMLYGKQDANKPGDALEQAYGTRATGNVNVEEAKTSAIVLQELGHTFQLISPDLVNFLHLIDALAIGFNKLPDPVQRFGAGFALAAAAVATGGGAFLLITGTIVKFGGAMLSIVGGGLKFLEFTSGLKILGPLGTIATKFGGVFEGILPRALGVASIAVRGLMALLIGNPIGLAITALIAVGTLFYEGWTHDWFNVQEKTAMTVQKLSGLFTFLKSDLSNFVNAGNASMVKFGESIRNGAGVVMTALTNMKNNVVKAAGDWTHSGEAMASNFINGITSGFSGGTQKVKDAIAHVGNLFPHSEPKDSSSPLYGATASGKAHANMFVGGMSSGILAGGAAIKSALDGLSSTFSNSVGGMIDKVLGGSGSKNPFSNAIGTFAKNALNGFITQMMKPLNNSLGNLLGGGSADQSSAMTNVLGTNGVMDSTLQNTFGQGGTMESTLSSVIAKWLGLPSGTSSTVAGAIVNAIPGSQVLDSAGIPYPTIRPDPKPSLFSRIGGGIAGAAAAYGGYQQGGIGGGLQTGLGILQTEASINPALAASPVGIGIAVAGGLFSMFSHHDNPANMPDKYDAQNFDNIQLELLGNNSHASGYIAAPSAALDPILQKTGGVGELDYIQQFIKANLNSSDASAKALAQKYLGEFGTSGGGLTYDKNIGQEHVVGGGLSGSYTDIGNAANDATQAILSMTDAAKSAALSQSQSADALAASFTTLILGGTAGFSMPLLAAGAYSAGLGAGAGAASGSGRVGTLPGVRATGGDGASLPIWSSTPPTVGVPGSSGDPRMPAPGLPNRPIHLHVMENFMPNATINGDKGAANEIASTVAAMMPSIVNQIRRANFQDSRLYGDYISAVS